MAFKINTQLKNVLVNDVITRLAGTTGVDGTASLRLYTGTQPANADAATSGTLLCTLTDISWAHCTGGTAALTASVSGTTSEAGTAGWARLQTVGAGTEGTFVVDGSVGAAGTNTFVLSNPIFTTAGGLVSLVTAPIYMA